MSDIERPVSSAGGLPIARSGTRPAFWAERWHKPAFIVFLIAWVLNWAMVLLKIEASPETRWATTFLLVSVSATTLLGLGRRLPFQNVLMAAALIAGISSGITAIGAWTGVPFGPIFYTGGLGEPLLGQVPWTVPLLWVVLIVNGRGVARLIMRPWRKTNYYGFWVIGLTCLLVVLFDLGFEPFAVHVGGYWIWLSTNLSVSWYTTPLANFFGWFVSSLGVVTFAIPWLINKHPVKQPTDYHPLIVWLLMSLWIGTGNALEGLWPAVVLMAVGNTCAAIYAIRGARW